MVRACGEGEGEGMPLLRMLWEIHVFTNSSDATARQWLLQLSLGDPCLLLTLSQCLQVEVMSKPEASSRALVAKISLARTCRAEQWTRP